MAMSMSRTDYVHNYDNFHDSDSDKTLSIHDSSYDMTLSIHDSSYGMNLSIRDSDNVYTRL